VAANLIKFDRTKELARMAIRGMQMIREGVRVLADARAAMIQARDGDGSQASHYDLLASEGGYQAGDYADANAAAKASFDEIDSLCAKLTTDASVSNVAAAIAQAPAKHGV
jgi:phosphoribosylformylglycinamidine (FGAM) synthase-like amidotransferase family enzyme